MPVPTHGVSELVIEATDLAASERFYTQALGLPVVPRWQGDAWTDREAVWVQSGEQTRIGLWKPADGISGARPGAHLHFALAVTEADYDPMVAQIRATASTSTRSISVRTPRHQACAPPTWKTPTATASRSGPETSPPRPKPALPIL